MRESRQPPSFKQEQKSRDERRACSGTAFLVVGEVGRVGEIGKVGRIGEVGKIGRVGKVGETSSKHDMLVFLLFIFI